jgi:hypothetical protein
MDPVVTAVRFSNPVSPLDGLGIGESAAMSVIALDSSRVPIPNIDPVKLGVQFSSSDPSVATISAAGVITGVGAGAVTISARYADSSSALSFRVGEFPVYDFGAVHRLYGRIVVQQYFMAMPSVIDVAGNSLFVINQYARPTGAGMTTQVNWFDLNGQLRLSHDYWAAETTELGNAAFDEHDGVYLSYGARTVALDASGVERWSVPFGGTVLPVSSGLYTYRGLTLHSVSSGGGQQWSHTFDSAISDVIPAPAMVFVRTSSPTASALIGLSSTGDSLWARPADTRAGITDEASTYYSAAPGGGIQAIDKGGNTLWTSAASTTNTVALGPQQSVIVAEPTRLTALSRATGAVLWSVSTPSGATKLEVIGNKVYQFANYLYVWDATTGAGLGRSAQRWPVESGRCTSSGMEFVAGSAQYRYDHC